VKPQKKITLKEMRAANVRGLLIYCSDYHCSHWTAISGDRWPDDVRLSDLEQRFTCQACGRRGADVRPHFGWETEAGPATPPKAEYGSPGHGPFGRLSKVFG
jgi:hypothetical protein